jgi:V/A-type H+-transporting ATPase subunit I
MIQRMVNVLVIGPKREYQEIIDLLYRQGSIHLQDIGSTPSLSRDVFRPMDTFTSDDLTALLVKINGIYQILPALPTKPDEQAEISEGLHGMSTRDVIQAISGQIGDLESQVKSLASRKAELELSKVSLERYEKIIDKIQPLENQIPLLKGYEVTVLLIQREFKDVLEPIRSVLKTITHNHFEMMAADLDEQTTAAITVFNKKYSEKVHSFLFSQNVNEVRIPEEYANMPLHQALMSITRKKLDIENEKSSIDQRLADLAATSYQKLVVYKELVESRKAEIESFNKFATSENTILIRGWVPKKILPGLKAAVHQSFGDRVVIALMDVPAKEMEQAPIFYDNPWWVRPFEFFNRLIAPPRYIEIDPSPFFAIFFPIFFGIIVGDIGYGLCILAFALALRFVLKKPDWIKQISSILIICSIPTMFFGYLFGEFFGDLGQEMGWLEPVTFLGITWDRLEAMIPLLIVAIAIGVIHVYLGLGLGALNAYYRKSRKQLFEKIGLIGVLTGLFIVIGTFAGVLPEILTIPAIVAMIVSLPLLIYGGGIRGAIEVMGSIGNILSYARIMAIGMASVILAMVANALGGAIGVVVIGVVIAVLLHTLNVVLAMFSPSIHSMRLHIVEFYSKFYEGGGELYRPFGKQKES